MQPKIILDLKTLILRGLEEDGYGLDWTTLGVEKARSEKRGKTTAKRARIVAKANGVFFGEASGRAAEMISEEIGFPFGVRALVRDGTPVKPGTVVAEWKGAPEGILAIERPYLNVVSYLSGIATRTRRFVSLVDGAWRATRSGEETPRVTPTRKTLPYYRDSAIAAVMAGGGIAHRVSLSGGVLIKENHIATAGGIRAAIRGVRAVAPHLLKIEVEVRNLKELREALAENADAIMLDNFSPKAVREALEIVKASGMDPVIECSGGISEETVSEYVIPGVHVLSVGGLTHSVKALDLSLLVE
jgi:nicotinate-nucleotide pyrophosphorylase (carboxylating)